MCGFKFLRDSACLAQSFSLIGRAKRLKATDDISNPPPFTCSRPGHSRQRHTAHVHSDQKSWQSGASMFSVHPALRLRFRKAARCLPAIHGIPSRILAGTLVSQRRTTAQSVRTILSGNPQSHRGQVPGFHSWEIAPSLTRGCSQHSSECRCVEVQKRGA